MNEQTANTIIGLRKVMMEREFSRMNDQQKAGSLSYGWAPPDFGWSR